MAEAVSSRWARSTDTTPASNNNSRGKPRRRGAPSTPRTPRPNTLPPKPDDQPAKNNNHHPRRRRPPPPAISTNPPPALDATPAPQSARSASGSNPRRRPHHAKHPRGGIPSAAAAALAFPSAISAPIKDTPPHLNQKLSVRNDIDALVEHVRAVAMDHPFTPRTGSHIDWAGDDDDSLPDLDDWGVNTATFHSAKSEAISPIVVDGLKQLPDVALPLASPPLIQAPIPLDAPPAQVPESPKVEHIEEQAPIIPLEIHTRSEDIPPLPSVPEKSMPQPLSAADVPSGKSCPDEYFKDRGGLSESIHAPKGPVNPLSAPADVSTYAEARSNSRHRPGPGHTRAQTIGRPVPPPQQQQQQQPSNRGSRSNPRHARNYSSPASSPTTPRRPPNAQRPVINADALTRLARQIGQTSSPRHSTTGSGDPSSGP